MLVSTVSFGVYVALLRKQLRAHKLTQFAFSVGDWSMSDIAILQQLSTGDNVVKTNFVSVSHKCRDFRQLHSYSSTA